MKSNRKKPENQKGAPLWMVTFTDLVTLILVFFILLFSMSQIDVVKFRAIADSFKERQILDFYPSIIPFNEPPSDQSLDPDVSKDKGDDNNNQGNLSGQISLAQLLGEVENFLEENGLDDVVIATRNERGVILVLPEKVLFPTGEATILSTAYPFLNKVGELLSNMPNMIKVEGHTDNRPINNYRYPSNWELSSARASSVIRYFIDEHELDSSRFIAVGYGETRPIVSNDGPENWQKNRRVEILIAEPRIDSDELVDQ